MSYFVYMVPKQEANVFVTLRLLPYLCLDTDDLFSRYIFVGSHPKHLWEISVRYFGWRLPHPPHWKVNPP